MKTIRLFLLLLLALGMSLNVVRADDGILYTSDKLTSNMINCMVQDHRGFIWVGTQNGLNRFDGYRFTPYYYKEGNAHTLPHNNITALFVDRSGVIWAGTPAGLAYYDEASNSFIRRRLSTNDLGEPRITQICQSRQGSLLVSTSGFKVFEVWPHSKRTLQRWCYSPNNDFDYFPAILIDRQNRFWFANNKGNVYCYTQPESGKGARLLLEDKIRMGLPVSIIQLKNGDIMFAFLKGIAVYNSSMHLLSKHSTPYTIESMMQSHQGEILVGTDGGIRIVDALGNDKGVHQVTNKQIDLSTLHISSLLEDAQHNLWVGSSMRGLLFMGNHQPVFNTWSLSSQMMQSSSLLNTLSPASDGGVWGAMSNGKLYHFDASGFITRTISSPGNQVMIHADRQGKQWVGCGKDLYSFDEHSGGFTFCKNFDCDFIQAVDVDKAGRIFVSTFGKGVAMYNPQQNKWRQFSMFDNHAPRGFLGNDWVYSILVDKQGIVWMATSCGISCYNPIKDSFKPYGWHDQLYGYGCITLAEGADGKIYVGTDRGLFCYDKRKKRIESLKSDKIINAIQVEPNGDLWCATSMGIWHYEKSTRRWLEHTNDDGLKEREYIRGAYCKLADGRLAFGNGDGIITFLPAHVIADKKRPAAPILTTLFVGDQTVSMQTLSDGKAITTLPVSQSKSFEFSYLDNIFKLEFSNFDYFDARNISLEYRLNDDPWLSNAKGDDAITFRHLTPGFYRLYVRIVKNGVASQVQVYNILVRSPWYSSSAAYSLYILLLLLIGGYCFYRYYRRKNEQLAEEKMQFIINATHDIRTPLTLILSPLHQLMRRKDNDEEAVEKLKLIDHNARRILNLVNQILDLRKIDKQQMTLKCEATDMVPFIQNIYKGFEAHAADRDILFSYTYPEQLIAWVDRIQMDKVVQNLLSNAFKFTSDGGCIELRLQEQGDTMKIEVLDNGSGLNSADIPRLFARFYQSAANQAQGKSGTGIGLNLCKMIVEMHHGKISAQNRTDVEHGSKFSVEIPLGKQHLQENTSAATTSLPATPANPNGKPYILVVDDDAEITDYIACELCATYQCDIAHNGKEALAKLLSKDGGKYRLVISDILMPLMDGFTLLRAIKSNLTIAHLPVILLTSESAVGNRLDGLRHGADAFMAKPFIMEELRLQIDNLLSKSRVMRAHFSGHAEERKEQVEQRDLADLDKQLMDRIMESVNKNLSDSEFTVEQLAADAGLSRSQLHRKMKELTGISPSEFLSNIRLEQAARLLKERKVNISQVAYTLGFNSPSAFSKAFKRHFGQSPTEYAAQEE